MCLCNEQANKISFPVQAVYNEIDGALFSGDQLKKIIGYYQKQIQLLMYPPAVIGAL